MLHLARYEQQSEISNNVDVWPAKAQTSLRIKRSLIRAFVACIFSDC